MRETGPLPDTETVKAVIRLLSYLNSTFFPRRACILRLKIEKKQNLI
jgi:hypothetical protein